MLTNTPFLATIVFDNFFKQINPHATNVINEIVVFVLAGFTAGEKEVLFNGDKVHDANREVFARGKIKLLASFGVFNLVHKLLEIEGFWFHERIIPSGIIIKAVKIIKQIIELMVDDVGQSVDFYSKFLGFKLKNRVEESWAEIQNESVVIQFLARKAFEKEVNEFGGKEKGGTFLLLFEIERVEEIYSDLKRVGEIVDRLRKTDYGTKEFKFKDNSGYIIQLTERVNG